MSDLDLIAEVERLTAALAAAEEQFQAKVREVLEELDANEAKQARIDAALALCDDPEWIGDGEWGAAGIRPDVLRAALTGDTP